MKAIRKTALKTALKTTVAAALVGLAAQAMAQVTFYEHDNFGGQSFSTRKGVEDFSRYGFNDRASSVVVQSDRWEVCEDARFGGRCVVLRPGQYPSLQAMGLNDRISSVRDISRDARIDDQRYAPVAPPPPVVYDSRRRPNERLYQADVTSVRAVLGQPEQRCWVEQQQVQRRGDANVAGAIGGGLLGGILGHQVGGGLGKDLATAAGAIGGAVVGSNIGRDNNRPVETQSVRRCDTAPADARPDYWDVTYNFRGQEHRAQFTAPPGRSITVNREGEPRS